MVLPLSFGRLQATMHCMVYVTNCTNPQQLLNVVFHLLMRLEPYLIQSIIMMKWKYKYMQQWWSNTHGLYLNSQQTLRHGLQSTTFPNLVVVGNNYCHKTSHLSIEIPHLTHIETSICSMASIHAANFTQPIRLKLKERKKNQHWCYFVPVGIPCSTMKYTIYLQVGGLNEFKLHYKKYFKKWSENTIICEKHVFTYLVCIWIQVTWTNSNISSWFFHICMLHLE